MINSVLGMQPKVVLKVEGKPEPKLDKMAWMMLGYVNRVLKEDEGAGVPERGGHEDGLRILWTDGEGRLHDEQGIIKTERKLVPNAIYVLSEAEGVDTTVFGVYEWEELFGKVEADGLEG